MTSAIDPLIALSVVLATAIPMRLTCSSTPPWWLGIESGQRTGAPSDTCSPPLRSSATPSTPSTWLRGSRLLNWGVCVDHLAGAGSPPKGVTGSGMLLLGWFAEWHDEHGPSRGLPCQSRQ